MEVFTLHQCNRGTPGANEIQSVHGSLEKARAAAIEHLKKAYHLTEEQALKEIGPEWDDRWGMMEYVYIDKHEVK